MRIPYGTAVSIWLAVAAALVGCAESAGSGKGGAGGSVECGGGDTDATCEAKCSVGSGGNTGGGGAGDPCEEPCIDDPGWDVMIGDECFCPDRVCGYDDCYGGWNGVCTDGYWHFHHWDGSDDPSCG